MLAPVIWWTVSAAAGHVLDIEGGVNVNAGIQQLQHILITFGMA